jgi:hypothetical protein
MGEIVEKYVKQRGHEVAIIIDPKKGTKKEDLL